MSDRTGCGNCVLLLEYEESCHGHKQQQDKADDWSDDDLYDVERVTCSTHPPGQ